MKQSDLFSVILVASIGTFAAFFLCQLWLGDPGKASVTFVAPREIISSKLAEPDPEVFNSTSENPTIEVYVGDCEDIDHNGILDETETTLCRCDKNKDGVLDDDEKAQCRKLDTCDKNKNGMIDDDEQECAAAFELENMPGLSGCKDINNDGKIDDSELILCRCDKNQDGFLDNDERQQCRKMDTCDTNKNGVIDDNERSCSEAFDRDVGPEN